MAPEARAKSKALADNLRSEMALNELRHAFRLSQTRLAELLEIDQPGISRIENNTDMLMSTLRSYIEAMGGSLEIVAKFPAGGKVLINQFKDLEDNHAQGQ